MQAMKKDIHPKYYKDAEIICACGNRLKIGSAAPSMKIEICSSCHPIFTGKAKLIDKAGRVDRFKEKMARYEKFSTEKKKRVEEKLQKQKEAEMLVRTRKR